MHYCVEASDLLLAEYNIQYNVFYGVPIADVSLLWTQMQNLGTQQNCPITTSNYAEGGGGGIEASVVVPFVVVDITGFDVQRNSTLTLYYRTVLNRFIYFSGKHVFRRRSDMGRLWNPGIRIRLQEYKYLLNFSLRYAWTLLHKKKRLKNVLL